MRMPFVGRICAWLQVAPPRCRRLPYSASCHGTHPTHCWRADRHRHHAWHAGQGAAAAGARAVPAGHLRPHPVLHGGGSCGPPHRQGQRWALSSVWPGRRCGRGRLPGSCEIGFSFSTLIRRTPGPGLPPSRSAWASQAAVHLGPQRAQSFYLSANLRFNLRFNLSFNSNVQPLQCERRANAALQPHHMGCHIVCKPSQSSASLPC